MGVVPTIDKQDIFYVAADIIKLLMERGYTAADAVAEAKVVVEYFKT